MHTIVETMAYDINFHIIYISQDCLLIVRPDRSYRCSTQRGGIMKTTLGKLYAEELMSEVPASRKCIERVPIDRLSGWKPHEKSMQMGYLTILVADMPRWITHAITEGVIDLKGWKLPEAKTAAALLEQFDRNIADAKKALENATDEALDKPFSLKRGDAVLMTTTKRESISSSINHWVHHRGQLTVYLRLNDIAVPSIYGPSADEKTF